MRTLVFLSCSGLAACTGAIGSNADGQEDGVLPDGTPVETLLTRDVRRLTNAEYDATVRALTGTTTSATEGFPPDVRQAGFTVNEGQIVDTVIAKQLAASAKRVAAEMRARVDEVAPCADPVGDARACATTFIEDFGTRVYRRPIEQVEIDGLLAVYDVGAHDAGYADGVELVVRALLQSAGMLYLTQLGDDAATGARPLTDHEIASAISYLVIGGPPDAALLDAAARGVLVDRAAREAEVKRLLATPEARERVVAFVREWLDIDRLVDTAKDSTVYPEFAAVRASMVGETSAFVTEVIDGGDGTVGELLGADWSVFDAQLATFYGVAGSGRTDLPDRRGILNQGAYLAVHAHAGETAPVLRGVALLRRVACIDVPAPTTLDISIVPPVPDPEKTTRERFTVHTQDPLCMACHRSIDPIGFAFEGFDGMGGVRAGGLDNGKPVDTSATVTIGADFDGTFADSNQLAAALAASADVRACFARQLFRAASGTSDDRAALSEDSFLAAWRAVPDAAQGDILASILAYTDSTIFSHRRAE